MFNEYIHIPDEELLLLADGEISSSRESQIRKHLAACWSCRARMGEIEGTISDFVRAYQHDKARNISSSDGPRVLLKARLAEAAAQSCPQPRRGFLQWAYPGRHWAYACAGVLLVVLAVQIRNAMLSSKNNRSAASRATIVPNSRLTPGATRPVALEDLCSAPHSDKNRVVATSVGQRIFREYGMAGAEPKDYEVDYLITPELGGADDIRNLWPEPYASTEWNASVKDALEDRLHQLVCEGKVDLSTAQREIATNWIAAYQKYFDTTKPLSTLPPDSSSRNLEEDQPAVADRADLPVSEPFMDRFTNLATQERGLRWAYSKVTRHVGTI